MTDTKIGERVFAEGVIENIREYLPPEYEDMKCEVMEQKKNNGVNQIGVSFRLPESHAAPVIGMECFYQQVQIGKPLEEIMQGIAEEVQNAMQINNYPAVGQIKDFEKVKENLSVRLVNTKANQQMLAELPHREIEDLSLICVIRIPLEDNLAIRKVDYDMIRRWNISEEELCQIALENAQEKQEPVLQRIFTIMLEEVSKKPSDENLLYDQIEPEKLMSEPVFILSNKEKLYGASVIAYPESLNKVSQVFPQGFYIIPSSIHEAMIIPKTEVEDTKHLGSLVRMVNTHAMEKSQVLSDRIYEYDKEHGKIRQVPESIKMERAVER